MLNFIWVWLNSEPRDSFFAGVYVILSYTLFKLCLAWEMWIMHHTTENLTHLSVKAKYQLKLKTLI
jgi:hypothetical protein